MARILLGAISAFFLVVGVAVSAQEGTAPHHRAAKTDAAPVMKSIGSVREIMEAITIPASDAVFNAGAEPPKDDKAWIAVRRQALVVAESANLLMMAERTPGSHDWLVFAAAQRDAALVAMKAADAKDADALSTAADALYETCAACHKQYLRN